MRRKRRQSGATDLTPTIGLRKKPTILELAMLIYSNPRDEAEFNDWPAGGKTVNCRFHVEGKVGKGFRVGRTTTHPVTGLPCKTKYHTYAGPAAIVDGSDGETYILQYVREYDFIRISRSDFMNAEESSVHRDNKERFDELMDIIKATDKK
jgi:hypothetical protein